MNISNVKTAALAAIKMDSRQITSLFFIASFVILRFVPESSRSFIHQIKFFSTVDNISFSSSEKRSDISAGLNYLAQERSLQIFLVHEKSIDRNHFDFHRKLSNESTEQVSMLMTILKISIVHHAII